MNITYIKVIIKKSKPKVIAPFITIKFFREKDFPNSLKNIDFKYVSTVQLLFYFEIYYDLL